MRFKAGDKVRVKENLIVGKYYGYYQVKKTMAEQYMGKVVTIRKIRSPWANAYKIEEDGGESYWAEEMFKPIEELKE